MNKLLKPFRFWIILTNIILAMIIGKQYQEISLVKMKVNSINAQINNFNIDNKKFMVELNNIKNNLLLIQNNIRNINQSSAIAGSSRGGDVDIGPGTYKAGDGGVVGKGGDLNIKAGDGGPIIDKE